MGVGKRPRDSVSASMVTCSCPLLAPEWVQVPLGSPGTRRWLHQPKKFGSKRFGCPGRMVESDVGEMRQTGWERLAAALHRRQAGEKRGKGLKSKVKRERRHMEGTKFPGCSLQGWWLLPGSMGSHRGSKGSLLQRTLGLCSRGGLFFFFFSTYLSGIVGSWRLTLCSVGMLVDSLPCG